MAVVDLIMPKMGESITEATILKWLKQPGDTVALDEPVLEIATDKVDSEVPAIAAGTIETLLYHVNDVIPVGAVIARIRTAQEEEVVTTSIPVPVVNVSVAPQEEPAANQSVVPSTPAFAPIPAATSIDPIPQPAQSSNGHRFFSPLVLNIAASEGIPMAELETLPGSGLEGRVTKKDILDWVARKNGQATTAPKTAPAYTQIPVTAPEPTIQPTVESNTSLTSPNYSGNSEIIEMDRMRKLIAKHMVDSKQISPHVTSFSEADVTVMVQWRERIKKTFESREKEKITFTPIIIEAIVKCLKKFPWLNSSVEGDKIIVKKDINIGMATALGNGNLIVPVIKGADQLNLMGITKQVNALAQAARNNKLKPDDTTGGTFTFTNVGTFGSLMGTPIINQPQVAIIAVGAIKKRPVVIESEEGDVIAIRHMMYLSMSYDHRIIDGSMGASFLTAVAKELEGFDPNREI